MGGSSYYTLLLFASLKSQGVIEGVSVITLFGRNKQRLNLIAEIGNSMFAGVTTVDVSVNIEDCLSVKYGLIFNQIRFGGMSSRDRDEKLALANGLAADETIGIVGVSNAIRAVKGMTAYLDIIKKKSNAYKLVNFTNPCSILTQYMVEHYNIPAIGICDYPEMMKLKIADALTLEADELQLGYFGLNHFGVIYSVKRHGEELIAQLLQTELPFKPACNRYFNHLLNVSWRYVYERQELVKEQQKTVNRAAQLLDFEKHMDELLIRGEREANIYFDVLNQRNCDWFNLVVSPLFANLLAQKSTPVIANIPTNDSLNIGDSICVMEGRCTGDFDVIESETLPPSLLNSPEYSLIRVMKLCERQLLKGILTNNKSLIIGACLNNPMIQEQQKVLAYFDELSRSDELINNIFNYSASDKGMSHEG